MRLARCPAYIALAAACFALAAPGPVPVASEGKSDGGKGGGDLEAKVRKAAKAVEEKLIAWRRDIHQHPELGDQETRTARLVAKHLRGLGLEVHEGIGGTGVVGVLRAGSGGKSVGLRADMDALPMLEQGERPYVSRFPGVHHGCGHDGHTAMLLGAARHLARTRRFNGTIHFIFQPAEEGRGGARAMVQEGLFERFPCDSVYALHNWPELPAGTAQTRPGAIMAAAGTLVSMFLSFNASIGIVYTLKALIVVIMGGVGRMLGCLLAGLLLGIAEVVGAWLVDPGLTLAINFALFLLVLLARPQGLFSRA